MWSLTQLLGVGGVRLSPKTYAGTTWEIAFVLFLTLLMSCSWRYWNDPTERGCLRANPWWVTWIKSGLKQALLREWPTSQSWKQILLLPSTSFSVIEKNPQIIESGFLAAEFKFWLCRYWWQKPGPLLVVLGLRFPHLQSEIQGATGL